MPGRNSQGRDSQGRDSNEVREAFAQLKQKGFVVVDAGSVDREALLAWAALLGRVQNHPKADADGIVDLVTDRFTMGNDQFDRAKASANAEFLPHSDGAFVDGFWVENGITRKVGPPALFLLQCVAPAERGGESLVIDAQAIFNDLQKDSPEIFSMLLRPSLSFCGGKDYALNKPLFEDLTHERWRVRFRSDLVLTEQSTRAAVNTFFYDYVLNPKYHQVFALNSGEILIADNFRLLHGRKLVELSSKARRHVRRLWIWDREIQTSYVTLEGRVLPGGSFQGAEKYRPLLSKGSEDLYSFEPGIRSGRGPHPQTGEEIKS